MGDVLRFHVYNQGVTVHLAVHLVSNSCAEFDEVCDAFAIPAYACALQMQMSSASNQTQLSVQILAMLVDAWFMHLTRFVCYAHVIMYFTGVLPSCRRKQREQKQYSKQIQAERLREKAQAKKKQITDVSKLRKQREKSVSGWARGRNIVWRCGQHFVMSYKG